MVCASSVSLSVRIADKLFQPRKWPTEVTQLLAKLLAVITAERKGIELSTAVSPGNKDNRRRPLVLLAEGNHHIGPQEADKIVAEAQPDLAHTNVIDLNRARLVAFHSLASGIRLTPQRHLFIVDT